jgi:hypothetical protein
MTTGTTPVTPLPSEAHTFPPRGDGMTSGTGAATPRHSNSRVSHKSRFAVVSDGVYQGRPVTRVLWFEDGFTLLDRAMQDENPDDHELEEFHVICESCVIDQHPEAARGMDIARRGGSGSSRFVEGHGWMEETQ